MEQGIYTGQFTPSGSAHTLFITGAAEMTTILNGGGTGTVFTNPSGYTVTLNKLTLKSGTSSSLSGAGGVVNHGNLTLNNVLVTSNTDAYPGTADATAGGIYNDATVEIENSTIIRNAGTPNQFCVGAVVNYIGGQMTLLDSNVTQNGCTGSGGLGGMNNWGGSTLDIYQSSIVANSANNSGNGGGIFSNGTLLLSGSSITGNSSLGATGDGGGIESEGGNLTIEGGLIANNSAGEDGGGIALLSGSPTLNISGPAGIDNNVAGIDGGGIYEGSGTQNIAPSVTVQGNTPDGIS